MSELSPGYMETSIKTSIQSSLKSHPFWVTLYITKGLQFTHFIHSINYKLESWTIYDIYILATTSTNSKVLTGEFLFNIIRKEDFYSVLF